MSIKVTIHSTGKGNCLLSEQPDRDGLTVSFDDGTVQESFLSWKAFRQLLALKAGQNGKMAVQATQPPVAPRPVS